MKFKREPLFWIAAAALTLLLFTLVSSIVDDVAATWGR